MLNIRTWLSTSSEKLQLPPVKIVEMFENVVMDDPDFEAQSKKIGYPPYYVEAAQIGRCQRPRLYWLSGVELIQGTDLTVGARRMLRGHSYQVKQIQLDTERPPLEWFLNQNAQKMAEPEEPFATFTRPIPRQSPPENPAGYEQASEKALKRWRGDSYRLQPYQYEARNLVTDANGPRRPTIEEQLRMMGFQSSHLNTKTRLTTDLKGQMVGNSFSAMVVARLLVGLVLTEERCQGKDLSLMLWEVWKAKEEKVAREDKPWKVRFASVAAGVPGVVSLLERVLPSPVTPLRSFIDPQQWLTDEEMLSYLLARNGTHRGAEIRIDLGMPYSVGELCRQSIDPSHWLWKVLMSYSWKQPGQHINVLELIAVLDLLRRQGRDSKFHGQRLVTLVDNQVPYEESAQSASQLTFDFALDGSRADGTPQMGPVVGPKGDAMPRQQVLGRRGRVERKRDRQALGSLKDLVVAKNTRDRYLEAVSRFLSFLQCHGFSYPTSFSALDGRVCEFIESLWQNGDPKSYASDCLSGLGHFVPQCKRNLVGAWRLHGSWTRAELPARALPFLPVMVYALAQCAFDNRWPDLALLLLLGFDTFARSGELFSAKKGDFTWNAAKTKAIWSLPLTKSGQRVGAQESLVIDDAWLVVALSNYLASLSPGDHLRTASPGLMRSRLKSLLSQLGLSEGYQWYSLRRGGATHAFRITNDLPRVCFIGRSSHFSFEPMLEHATCFSAAVLLVWGEVVFGRAELPYLFDVSAKSDDLDWEVYQETAEASAGRSSHRMLQTLDRFIVIVDESKLCDGLGPGFPVPVEIVPFCHEHTMRQIAALPALKGCEPVLRLGNVANNQPDGDEPAITDNGNYIVDLKFSSPIKDPVAAGEQLKATVGVVDHGLFTSMTTACIVAGSDGIIVKEA
eukprot:s1363_g2.t1